MRKRLFLAIPLNDQTRTKLTSLRKKILLPTTARWTKQDNLHITVIFFGKASTSYLSELTSLCTNLCKEQRSFVLPFKHLVLAPPNKPPSMLWAEYHADQHSSNFFEKFDECLSRFKESTLLNNKKENIPHVT